MESKAVTDWKRKVARKREKERLRLQRLKEEEQDKIIRILQGKNTRPSTSETNWTTTSSLRGATHHFRIEDDIAKLLAEELTNEIDQELIDSLIFADFEDKIDSAGSPEIILNRPEVRATWNDPWKRN